MPNRNIYFKTEQYAKMLTYRTINWSEICQKAIDEKLEEIERKAEETSVYKSESALVL